MKILVVDDERWIRKGIVKMIQKETLQIEEIFEADGVKSGWEMFLKEHPQLVISDVKFPADNGCILCERIYSAYPETKIIMLSGYGEFEYVKAALKYKALDYLLKPVDKMVLNQTIAQAFAEIRKKEKPESHLGEIQKNKSGSRKGEDLIKEVIQELQANYSQRLSLTELAGKYFVNETYLSNLFTKTVGISMVNYLMQLRVEEAKAFLLTTRLSVTDIAFKVGYENARYFMRVFKKVTGETPKEYRLRLEREIENED